MPQSQTSCALPLPTNPSPPYPIAQSSAAFVAQQTPDEYHAPQNLPQSATNPQLPFPPNSIPQTHLYPMSQSTSQSTSNITVQPAVPQPSIPGLQLVMDAARDFLYQPNNPNAPSAHFGQEGYGRWQDQPQAPPQAYRSPPMPPPPLLLQSVPQAKSPSDPTMQCGSQTTELEVGPSTRPTRSCRAPKETKKSNEKAVSESAGGGKGKNVKVKGKGKGKGK